MKRLAVLCAVVAALAGSGAARAVTVPAPVTPPGTALTQPGGPSDGPDLDGVCPALGIAGVSDGPDLD